MSKTIKMKQANSPEEMKILFRDNVAKSLFTTVLTEYGAQIEDLMSKMSPALGFGAIEPVIDVRGDEIVIESTVSDKGMVLTSIGYQKYSEVKEGQKYCAIKEGRFGLFVKSGERDGVKQADVLKGYAPSINEAYVDMTEKEELTLEGI